MNTHEAAGLNLLSMLSRYCQISDSVHHDEWCSSLGDIARFRHDEQHSSVGAEGLTEE